MKKKKRIRPLAICIFRNRDRILVAEGYDSVKDEYFYRPLGGGIEFGESSVETICRELREEIRVEVDRDGGAGEHSGRAGRREPAAHVLQRRGHFAEMVWVARSTASSAPSTIR